MAFSLSGVVPWGRSLGEYAAMFDLSARDLSGRVLGCGDGPASFNAEAHARGTRVVSCDPLYRFSAEQIRTRVAETYAEILDQVSRNRESFVWRALRSPEHLGEVRLAAMERFLEDYPRGRAEGRYVCAALPALPFADAAFDLALCSHFLFLYSAHHGLEFHLRSLRELGRVAREVRVFPLVDLAGAPSPHLEPVAASLRREGWMVERAGVGYEFQRGADEMLRIRRPRGAP